MTAMTADSRCLRVPPPPPAVCEPSDGSCAAREGVCAPRPAPLPTEFEVLERYPALYARRLTDAQVETLIFVAESGGIMFPDGADQEVYARLEGKAGRRPPGVSSRDHWNQKQVRPALIAHGSSRWSEKKGRRSWALTPIGRAVLAQFHCFVQRKIQLQQEGVAS